MKVLITGASGFLGSETANVIKRNSHEIITLGRGRKDRRKIENTEPVKKSEKNEKNEKNEEHRKNNKSRKGGSPVQKTNFETNFESNLETDFAADISSFEEIEKLEVIGKIDAVIHCAGLAHQFGNVGKEDFWRVNVEGTRNVAKLAARLAAEKFILISSVAVYGQNRDTSVPFEEKAVCRPGDFYAESKLESEHAARKICEENGIELTIVRPATIIGEGDRGNFLRLIRAIDRNRFIWLGRGENLKSLIYKRDVAEACLFLLNRKEGAAGIYNLSAEPLKMNRIVGEIYAALGKKERKWHIPTSVPESLFFINQKFFRFSGIEKLAATVGKWRSDDVFSTKKIKEIGFEPATEIKRAIALEVEYYKAHNR